MNSNLDLIPVSSTVIPLHELTVSSHGNGTDEHIPKMLSRSEIKKLLKKQQISEENPHELITAKKSSTRRKSRMAYVFRSV
uniref:CSON013381 protein n=1 Tax=Culicoides sonorensis TaxID=179676 RepID=A0A336KPS4_CULSO